MKRDSRTGTWTIEIMNDAGAELPHSGGTGTLPMTVVGILLIGVASMWLTRMTPRRG